MSLNYTVLENNKPFKVEVVNVEPIQNPRFQIGVRWIKGQQVSTIERITILDGIMKVGVETGLVFEVGHDNIHGLSSFDDIPLFQTRKIWHQGNAFIEFKEYFYRRFERVESETTYVYLLFCQTQLPNYKKYELFQNGETVYVGVYEGYRDSSGKLRSIPNTHQTVNRSAINLLNDARNNDGLGIESDYLITDLLENIFLADRWLVKTATKNSQSVMMGATGLQTSNDSFPLIDEENVNHVVLPLERALTFVVGQTIIIGDSNYRLITSIEQDLPEEGQATIYFDGTPINVLATNNVISRPWITGITDKVLATDGYFNQNNGKFPMKFDGIENPFGNTWKNIAGIKILGDEIYVSSFPKNYNWLGNIENYSKLNYVVPRQNGYVGELGFDERYPFAQLTQSLGGSSSTYWGDYFYQNYIEGEYRTVFVGGYLFYGTYAGLRFWDVSNGLGRTDWYFGSRLSYRPKKGVLGDTPPVL